ncbi:ImmA/IrrE family metallo-endopeptidase [bacterium]|nr:ImmA/IrrE family metallo-endopeptidase [bacterium]
MGMGERIRLARRRAGLSLRSLAPAVGVSHAAISKYERDEDVPSSGVLQRLAKALDVKIDFFFRTVQVSLSTPQYRALKRVPAKVKDSILADVQERLERYIATEEIIGGTAEADADLPRQKWQVDSLEQAEDAAARLRKRWKLGLDEIENVVALLEEKGIKIALVDPRNGFDALTLLVNDAVPAIALSRDMPGDRQRFNVCHELGHLVMDCARDVDEEKAAHRFATAFLVPADTARAVLGEARHKIGLHELYLLKHRFGLSMQAWIYRAKDLGILGAPDVAAFFQEFGKRGWCKAEPGEPYPSEEPRRMERLVTRAIAEDIISLSRGAELMGVSLAQFRRLVGRPADDNTAPGCP